MVPNFTITGKSMEARKGRGNSPDPLSQDDIMKISRSRPARKQLQKRPGPQIGQGQGETRGSGVYNIWYNRFEGDRDRTRVKVPLLSPCCERRRHCDAVRSS
jgi:hypothetical protein